MEQDLHLFDGFAAGGQDRIRESEHPGWSRVYASVLKGGHIRVGAPVIVEHETVPQRTIP